MAPLLLAFLALASADRPIVAVFPIQDSAGRLDDSAVTQLTDYFATKIAETQMFVVVPRSDLEAALRNQKRESFKLCVDESCQIEIGKELAAQFLENESAARDSSTQGLLTQCRYWHIPGNVSSRSPD